MKTNLVGIVRHEAPAYSTFTKRAETENVP